MTFMTREYTSNNYVSARGSVVLLFADVRSGV